MEIKNLSATGIRDYLQCALKLVFRYSKDIPSFKNDYAKVGIAVHTAIEQFTRRMLAKKSFPDASDYEFAVATFMNSAAEERLRSVGFYTEGKQMVTEFIDRFDPSEEIIDTEYRFREVTPEGVPITGAIDKIVKINDDTIGIIDYKTSRRALTPWELQEDIQLSMYDLAAALVWPEYKNRLLFLEYVRINKRISTYRTEEERQTFREFLTGIWLQIQKLNDRKVEGQINELCGWCDYKKHCPVYAAFIKSENLELPPLSEMRDAEFLEQWNSITDKKAVLEARQRELKMIANEKFMEGVGIKADGQELYSTQQSRTNYDIEKIVELIPQEDLFSVLAVNKTKLDRYSKDDPELKNQLAKIAQVNYNAPTYKTRAVKEEVDDVDDDIDIQDEDAA